MLMFLARVIYAPGAGIFGMKGGYRVIERPQLTVIRGGAEPLAGTEYLKEVFGSGGRLSKQLAGYLPRSGQIALATAIDRAIRDGRHVIGEGPTGCHAVGQGILMYDGSVRAVEKVCVGDRLMGPDGMPKTVLALAGGWGLIVKVRPKKGLSWEVNEDHILTLVRTDTGAIVDVAISLWRTWSKTQKHLYKLFRVGVEAFEEAPNKLPIPPYLLGCLLGDGSMISGSVGLTKAHPAIRDAVYLIADLFGLRVREVVSDTGVPTFFIVKKDDTVRRNPLITVLRELGLYGKGAASKFIPSLYKRASIEDRLELLAGLVDTDGSLTHNCYDYTTASQELAEDIAFVARSTKFAAYPYPCTKSAYPGHVGTYYRMCISGDTWKIPCHVVEKHASARAQPKSVLRTGLEISDPDLAYEDFYYGFSLDGDGRYLLDDFTVTHNTGKSLAYSVPAAYHATHSERRFCIVTANKTLQGQIANKDLPLLQSTVDWPFTFAVRKGLNSYLCERDFRLGRWRDILFEQDLKVGEDDQIEKTRQWAAETTTGDFEESPGPSRRVWSAFSTTRDNCDGKKCKEFKQCFVQAAKEKSTDADIVVTNYHLFYLHLRHMAQGRPGWILPPFDVAILDEAHNAAGIARDFFGDEITFGSVYRCVTNMHMYNIRGFKKRGQDLREAVLFEARRLWVAFGDRARSDRNLFQAAGDCNSKVLEDLLEDCAKFYQKLAIALDVGGGRGRSPAASQRAVDADLARKLIERCDSVRMRLQIFRELPTKDLEPGQRLVYYIEGTGKEEKGKFPKLKSKALLVGGYLNSVLFEPYSTVVQTSATLAIRGSNKKEDFFYLKKEMGMSRRTDVTELVVESPFDWEKQTLLVIPEDMPAYTDSTWSAEVCHRFDEIIRTVGGRTLGLFTSFKMLHMVRDYLRDRSYPFQILAQGDVTNAELQRRFREDVTSVLLGSQSFAEGVDIQGEACTCVVLDKIPFIPPNDPLLRGLEQFERNVFVSYQIPEAIIAFKQRIGRLIRTVNDVGVIVVLDNRILTKRYGSQFLTSIPPVKVAKRTDAIAPFLERIGASR